MGAWSLTVSRPLHLIAGITVLVLGAVACAAMPPTLVVETWNIRHDNPGDGPHAWSHRRAGVIRHLEESGADVIGLQEVLPGQLEALRKGLPGFDVFARGRERDGRTGEAVPILWRRDRWRLDESAATHFWLSESPDVPGSMSWNTACTRMVTVVRLVPVDADASRTPIWIFNVHLDHRSAEARLNGMRLLRKRLAAMTAAHPNEPVVVMGDFNTPPDSPPIAALSGPGDEGGFVDAWAVVADREANAARGTWNGWKIETRSRRIDLVLVRGLSVESADILRPTNAAGPLSDHWPVRVVSSMPGRSESNDD